MKHPRKSSGTTSIPQFVTTAKHWVLPSAEMKKIKKRIESRKIVQTRYLDVFTLKSPNIYDEMQTLLDALGQVRFVHKQDLVYPTLVHEFMASLSTTAHKYELDHKLTIHFRCLGQDRELSLDEFHHIFRLSTNGLIRMPTNK